MTIFDVSNVKKEHWEPEKDYVTVKTTSRPKIKLEQEEQLNQQRSTGSSGTIRQKDRMVKKGRRRYRIWQGTLMDKRATIGQAVLRTGSKKKEERKRLSLGTASLTLDKTGKLDTGKEDSLDRTRPAQRSMRGGSTKLRKQGRHML